MRHHNTLRQFMIIFIHRNIQSVTNTQETTETLLVVVVVVSLLRMCQTHKHIQSNIKHLYEIKDLIKNIEYRTMV